MQTLTIYQTRTARAAAGIYQRNPGDRLLVCWVEYDPPATGDEPSADAVYESVRVHTSDTPSDYYSVLLTLAENALAPYTGDGDVVDLLDSINDTLYDVVAQECEEDEE